MDYNHIRGDVIVIFESGRDFMRFREKYWTEQWPKLAIRHGLCAYRFIQGKKDGYCSNPKKIYNMGDDITICKTINFDRRTYDVIFYHEKAVIV